MDRSARITGSGPIGLHVRPGRYAGWRRKQAVSALPNLLIFTKWTQSGLGAKRPQTSVKFPWMNDATAYAAVRLGTLQSNLLRGLLTDEQSADQYRVSGANVSGRKSATAALADKEKKAPKTVFEWAVGPKEDKDKTDDKDE
jgi:hypothetical protein